MQSAPAQEYLDVLNTRFGGVIHAGSHKPESRKGCALEIAHVVVSDPWSDQPDKWPDIRPINDGPWQSVKACTNALVSIMMAYWEWADWPDARRFRAMSIIALETVRQILADLPELDSAISTTCRRVQTLSEVAAATAQAIKASSMPGETEEEVAIAAKMKLMTVDEEIATRAMETMITDALTVEAIATEKEQTKALIKWVEGWTAIAVTWAATYAVRRAMNYEAAVLVPGTGTADHVLARACQIWVDAAIQTQPV